MNEEIDFTEAKPVEVSPAKKIVDFFAGEGTEKFVTEEKLETVVEYHLSLKKSQKEIEIELEKTAKRIKDALGADKMEAKKTSTSIGGHTVIMTRREGSVKIEYEKYIEDVCGEKELKDLLQQKEMVKNGQMNSKYVSIGKGSVTLEVI